MKGISGKEWVLLSERVKPDKDLEEKYGHLIAQILSNRNLDENIFDNKLKNLLPYYTIPNIEEGAERITRSIKKGERIIIYGDYDVDGITGSVMLYDFLKRAGAKVYAVFPSRQGGYGLSRELVEEFSNYANLLITVDNGTTATQELKNSKIETIIIDHHNPHDEIPKALVINPKIGNVPDELKEVSSATLSFYLVAKLRRELNIDFDVRNYLYLTAMGTLADVMPLNYLNRIIVSNGIRVINHMIKHNTENSYGIKALVENIGIKGDITSRDISFSIAPRLNAPGRVSKTIMAMNLLLSKDERTARMWAKRIEEANSYRKYLSDIAFKRAMNSVKEQQSKNFLVVKMEEWVGGVAGIVAGRLSNILSKPSAVFSMGKEFATASVRGVEGLNIYEGIKKLSHMFVKWGGHASAAGLTIRVEDMDRFEKYVDEVFSEMRKEEPKLYIDILLEPKEVKEDVLRSLIRLEPYGEGFPTPVFMSHPLRVERAEGNTERLVLRSNQGVHFLSYNPNINKKLISMGYTERRIAYTADAKRRVFNLVDVEDS